VDNKERIAKAGGIKPLIALASSKQIGVAVEAIAALANLAVNGTCIRLRASRSAYDTRDNRAVRRRQ